MNAQVSASRMLRASRLLVVAGIAWTVLAGLATGDSAARRTAAPAADSWIVIASNRDGVNRAYSIRPDGSRLTPLLRGRRLVPIQVSRNGETVGYTPEWFGDGPIYLSRASGAGLHRVAKDNVGGGPTLAHDGRWIAYSPSERGRRLDRPIRRTRASTPAPLQLRCLRLVAEPKVVVARGIQRHGRRSEAGSVVVLPLHGKRRVVARYGEDTGQHHDAEGATFSANGRWIAYLDTRGQRREARPVPRPPERQPTPSGRPRRGPHGGVVARQ